MESTGSGKLFEEMKVCVLIPTYNNAPTLPGVLKGVLAITPHVILVNDGSTDETLAIAGNHPQLVMVSYAQNKGKGYALRKGFEAARNAGYDYAISIDSDGQHFPEDIPLFLEALRANPKAIVIGTRNMDQPNVPGKSSFGNKFSSFWFRVETGITRNDTQSGFRLYPLQPLKEISFVTRKFEFEIEVLVRAAWSGIAVEEIPVRVFYPEKGKRISHFRPLKDFTRISILNTVLVFIAFLYIKPRDFFRSIKKKISSRSFATIFSTRMNLMHERLFQ